MPGLAVRSAKLNFSRWRRRARTRWEILEEERIEMVATLYFKVRWDREVCRTDWEVGSGSSADTGVVVGAMLRGRAAGVCTGRGVIGADWGAES